MATIEQEAFDAILVDAVAAQVVIELPNVHGRCSFTHSLIRQTLYEGLTETRRARLHLSVAEALERLAGEHAEPPLAELAHHFVLAPPSQGAAKAAAYAERAAGRASAVVAHEEAIRLYQMALQALRHVGDDPHRRYALLMRLGDAQTKATEAKDARASYRRAGEIARALDRPEDLGWRRSATARSGRWRAAWSIRSSSSFSRRRSGSSARPTALCARACWRGSRRS